MKKFLVLIVTLFVSAPSVLAQDDTYLPPKMGIAELDVVQKGDCIVVTTDNKDDLICFFTEDGRQLNVSGYSTQTRTDKRYDYLICRQYFNLVRLQDAIYIGVGGTPASTIKQWAYRVKH